MPAQKSSLTAVGLARPYHSTRGAIVARPEVAARPPGEPQSEVSRVQFIPFDGREFAHHARTRGWMRATSGLTKCADDLALRCHVEGDLPLLPALVLNDNTGAGELRRDRRGEGEVVGRDAAASEDGDEGVRHLTRHEKHLRAGARSEVAVDELRAVERRQGQVAYIECRTGLDDRRDPLEATRASV